LLVVYGAFLVVVGVTATVQTALVSLHFSTAAINTAVAGDVAIVRAFVNDGLAAADLTDAADPARVEGLDGLLGTLATNAGIRRLEVRDPAGAIRLSSATGDATADTAIVPPDAVALDGAAAGTAQATILDTPAGDGSQVLRALFPLLDEGGQTRAIVGVWRDAGPILAPIGDLQRDMLIVTLAAAAVAGAVLYLAFRSAQTRISRQTEQLLDATATDPLTGLLNHGAVVAELAVAVEKARNEGTSIGVALVDVDNFRLLNETHGHDAGDETLRTVVATLRAQLERTAVIGRYGPDEFLVIATSSTIAELEPRLERVRDALVDVSLQLEASERLPITISTGISTFPVDSDSVTGLLSSVALVLGEAKAGGGDAIRVTGRSDEDTDDARTFNVLQGLVFAIDTKDRYTKRHSEDVARYAVFLAERVGLESGLIEAIRTAGLLHDVGKIGIPDTILRKPGALTADEYDVVKQHVALGESIVRDLVAIEIVRTGIRHHHERWDGKGYLDGLAGEEIPVVARILAVGDAFSAMTTTRPYRKALSVEEALRRLEDAAGSQLDERLVRSFIEGIEHAADAPLPDTLARIPLWLPAHRVA
jgi:diguanylate cyclase (GGDEF)-like protein/putative nucleotidyltransferase with HDIG domain